MTTLYLDMDGVVADFNEYAGTILNKQNIVDDRWPDDEWNILKENPRLYRNLKKTKEADTIVAFCKTYCKEKQYQLLFLTAVPKANDISWAFYDKVLWIQEYYPDIPVMFGPYSKDKHTHCTPGDILIDDRSSNINEWIDAGGIGLLYKNNFDVIKHRLLND
jgi:5'(3')-deoxyribonucleotidase